MSKLFHILAIIVGVATILPQHWRSSADDDNAELGSIQQQKSEQQPTNVEPMETDGGAPSIETTKKETSSGGGVDQSQAINGGEEPAVENFPCTAYISGSSPLILNNGNGKTRKKTGKRETASTLLYK
jgi:hypothetical protein